MRRAQASPTIECNWGAEEHRVDACGSRKRVRISTDDVPSNESLAYWEDVSVATVVGVTCHPFADFFHASQISVDLGDLRIIEIEGVKHMVERSPALVRKHSKPSLFLSLVVEGNAFLYQGDQCVMLNPGDMALYSANASYVLGWASAARHITFDLPDDNAELRSGEWLSHGPAKIDGAVGLGRFLSRNLRSSAQHVLSSEEALHAEHSRQIWPSVELCLRMVQGGSCLPLSGGAALLRAQAYIMDNLANSQLDCETVSSALRLSTRHLHRLFEATGTSVRRWVLTQRLNECARALKDPKLLGVSLAEICYRWGFGDAAHFSRTFKAAYGSPPREYRELHKAH